MIKPLSPHHQHHSPIRETTTTTTTTTTVHIRIEQSLFEAAAVGQRRGKTISIPYAKR